MNTNPRCSADQVHEFLRVRREYRRRKKLISARLIAVRREMESVDHDLIRLDGKFREIAAPNSGPVYEGVFTDGGGGFVTIKATRGHSSAHPSLSVEPVLDCS